MAQDIIKMSEVTTLAALFRERVRRSADKNAYHHWDKSAKTWQNFTWQDMATQVARWQAALSRE